MLIDIVINLCVAVTAFLMGMRTTAYLIRARLASAMTAWQAAENAQSSTMLLYVEQVQDQIYCYEHGTNKFVCQGANVEEIWTTFQKLFPDVNARVTSGDDQLMDRIRTQVRQINETM
jgi:shikimate 5-dehydrogenase